ncbi:hypothetical protein BH23CHL7_BH23CHL7_16760 [soil metagenome]
MSLVFNPDDYDLPRLLFERPSAGPVGRTP